MWWNETEVLGSKWDWVEFETNELFDDISETKSVITWVAISIVVWKGSTSRGEWGSDTDGEEMGAVWLVVRVGIYGVLVCEGESVEVGNSVLRGYQFSLYLKATKLSVMVASNILSRLYLSKLELEQIVKFWEVD